MPILNVASPIYYNAYGFASGLTDVNMYVLRPDQTTEGPYTLTELSVGPSFIGVYYYNYTFTQIGTYLIIIDSITLPDKNTQIFEIIQKSPFMERV